MLSIKIPFATPGESRFTHPVTVRAGENNICRLANTGTQEPLLAWGESQCTFTITRAARGWDVVVRFTPQWTRSQGVEYEIQVQAPIQIRQAAPDPALVPLEWGTETGPVKRTHSRGLLKEAQYNQWYLWTEFTAQANGLTDCYVCSKPRPEKLYVTSTHLGWEQCEEKTNQWLAAPANRLENNIPTCEAACLAYLGSREYTEGVDGVLGKTTRDDIKVSYRYLDGMLPQLKEKIAIPTAVSLILEKSFEYYEKQGTVEVGTVPEGDCSYIWEVGGVCTKLIAGQARQIKGEKARRPIPPSCPYHYQNQVVADVFWLCDYKAGLRSTLPLGWGGRCARVHAVTHVVHFKLAQAAEKIQEASRVRRAFTCDVTIDAICQPRGVPNDFKARNEVIEGLPS